MEREPVAGTGEFLGALDVSIDLPLAGVGSRCLAHLVDFLLLLAVFFLLAGGLTLAGALLPDTFGGVIVIAMTISFFLLYWGFFTVLEWRGAGQSPGKRIVGLRVVSESGASASATELLLRNLLRFIDFLPMFYGLGALMTMLHPRGKRLGDLLAGTVVVRDEEEGPRGPGYHWPAGIAPEAVALIEAMLERMPGLIPERRESLALELNGWLDREYPGLLPAEGGSAAERLARAFVPGSESRAAD